MAGLYIHIPFCSSRCVYCAFFSTTQLELRQRYVDALCREMTQHDGFTRFDTVYLGGGTPSQLTASQLHQLFDAVNSTFLVAEGAEVTMECNPDDVTEEFATALASLPVNRVSMGAQTFNNERLRFLRRRHRAEQVGQAVDRLRRAGIENISVDLMYGFPEETLQQWHADIDAVLALGTEHVSAYALTYEEGTPLYRMLQQGSVSELDEELQRQMYYDLKDRLQTAGFEHYELSNFGGKVEGGGVKGEEDYRSRHNCGYWNHTPYLGLGAGAHSLLPPAGEGIPLRRQWNVSDLQSYLTSIENGHLPAEGEDLDEAMLYNEQVMTRLRTSDGLPLAILSPQRQDYCQSRAAKFIRSGWLRLDDGILRLTREGLFVSDAVMADLF